MGKLKNWIIAHSRTIVVALVVLLGGYYMYLTSVSQVFHIRETYYASDEYSMIVMKFDGDTMSTYFISPSLDTIAVRIDYQVEYRKYTEDIVGNFWSNNGIEPLVLRGADIAGRLYAECVGLAVWTMDEEMTYYDRDDILEMEETNDTSCSFGSRFSLKGGNLRVYNFSELTFQKAENIPAVEAEIMRLIDSLCAPKF